MSHPNATFETSPTISNPNPMHISQFYLHLRTHSIFDFHSKLVFLVAPSIHGPVDQHQHWWMIRLRIMAFDDCITCSLVSAPFNFITKSSTDVVIQAEHFESLHSQFVVKSTLFLLK